jgi:hypothetical protein
VSYAAATALTSVTTPGTVMVAMGLLLTAGTAAACFVPVLRQR